MFRVSPFAGTGFSRFSQVIESIGKLSRHLNLSQVKWVNGVPKCEMPRKPGMQGIRMRIGVRGAEDETGLISNVGPEQVLKHSLKLYFSYRCIKLPWFLQKPARGHGVAPVGSRDYCQGGTVSLRKTGVLLAVMAAALGVGGGGGEDAQRGGICPGQRKEETVEAARR